MLLAIDDTDGKAGGCTTHLAFHVLLALPQLALRGMPRLVRLNPNVPWKTRGNGAVVLPLGLPEGPQVRVGELRGREILAFPDGRPARPTPEMLERVWKVVQGEAQPDAEPAAALLPDAPPAWAYWQAVRSVVEIAEAREALDAAGALHRSAADGRGLVGCLGASAWPGPPASHEVIAYRHPSRWGSERAVDPTPLLGLDAAGATFHTSDPEEGRLACVPHTPDPVLCGLRGRDPDALRDAALRALALACKEEVDGWLLWATNQASGDHVTPVADLGEAPAMATVEVEATVREMPDARRGGHVFVEVEDGAGHTFKAAAFEPTKRFRDAVRALRPGDRAAFLGALRDDVVQLEKMRVDSLAASRTKTGNPRCPSCGKAMKSAGRGAGYRCKGCGTEAPAEAGGFQEEPRGLALGWHEVPVIARRHLHRPAGWT
ncbi:MAG TPA: tRNA(Ile)(2)-agmatinylcytidine synthase [Candidatus Thermoplasmatota archaeon]|nr:tRNA(Ile)(2)-agmatinylcytidine synthase [Candidatus Thermoplasmatota archaeon]